MLLLTMYKINHASPNITLLLFFNILYYNWLQLHAYYRSSKSLMVTVGVHGCGCVACRRLAYESHLLTNAKMVIVLLIVAIRVTSRHTILAISVRSVSDSHPIDIISIRSIARIWTIIIAPVIDANPPKC